MHVCKVTYKGNILNKLPDSIPKYLNDEGNTVQEIEFFLSEMSLSEKLKTMSTMMIMLKEDAQKMGEVLTLDHPVNTHV